MVNRLFENFLNDPEEYQASERYWEDVVKSIAQSLGQEDEWNRWIPRSYPNGTPVELDGNPIIDGRSMKINRAFRIIQHEPVNDELELAAWLKSYEEEYSELPNEELVINLSLSAESAELAKKLLHRWMVPTTTVGEMQTFIRDVLPNE